MTDQVSFPPLLDLSTRELQAHRQHLVSEIAPQPESRRLSLPGLPPVRPRFALPATNRGRILGIAAVAGAAVLIGLLAVPGLTSHHGSPGSGFVNSRVGGSGGAGLAANVVPLRRAMSDASKWFGAPLILPDTSVLKPSDAASMASEQWLPSPKPGVQEPLSQVLVVFRSPYVSITYEPTTMTYWGSHYPDALEQYRAEIAQGQNRATYGIISLSGTPALIDAGKNGNGIEFRLGKLSITIWAPDNNGMRTSVDAAKLQALAQSMIDQAATANQSQESK